MSDEKDLPNACVSCGGSGVRHPLPGQRGVSIPCEECSWRAASPTPSATPEKPVCDVCGETEDDKQILGEVEVCRTCYMAVEHAADVLKTALVEVLDTVRDTSDDHKAYWRARALLGTERPPGSGLSSGAAPGETADLETVSKVYRNGVRDGHREAIEGAAQLVEREKYMAWSTLAKAIRDLPFTRVADGGASKEKP
jgi:hypothetical protein